MLVAAIVVATLLTVPTVISDFSAGYTLVAAQPRPCRRDAGLPGRPATPAASPGLEPIYQLSDPAADAAFNAVATGIVVLAVLAYFAHQRDRFQRRSDDLLHNILPTRSLIGSRAGRC